MKKKLMLIVPDDRKKQEVPPGTLVFHDNINIDLHEIELSEENNAVYMLIAGSSNLVSSAIIAQIFTLDMFGIKPANESLDIIRKKIEEGKANYGGIGQG